MTALRFVSQVALSMWVAGGLALAWTEMQDA